MIRVVTVLAVVAGVAVVWAQAPVDQPQFEVASVKRNRAPTFARFSILPGGQLIVQGYPLASIVQHAFNVSGGRVTGMPEWARSDRYDITAKAAAGIPGGSQQVMAMLRTLLHTRFNLRSHFESRELPIYRLTLARNDGRHGPGLRVSDGDCSGFTPGRSEAPEPDAGPECTIVASVAPGSSATTFRLLGRSMTKLAADFEGFAGRPVRDATGLPGLFDVELSFFLATGRTPVQGRDDVTFFTALQEQLGLKLEPSRGPVDVLVIDSLEQPAPN